MHAWTKLQSNRLTPSHGRLNFEKDEFSNNPCGSHGPHGYQGPQPRCLNSRQWPKLWSKLASKANASHAIFLPSRRALQMLWSTTKYHPRFSYNMPLGIDELNYY